MTAENEKTEKIVKNETTIVTIQAKEFDGRDEDAKIDDIKNVTEITLMAKGFDKRAELNDLMGPPPPSISETTVVDGNKVTAGTTVSVETDPATGDTKTTTRSITLMAKSVDDRPDASDED